MIKSLWVNLNGETNIAVKAQCVKCTDTVAPDALRVLVLKGPTTAIRARQAGRIRICGGACIKAVEARDVIFNKTLFEVTADDIRWLLTEEEVNYTLFEQDLLVDFCILIHNYRGDVRFQNF
jgi:hypothetical protein